MYGVVWSDTLDQTERFADVADLSEATELVDALKHNGWDAHWTELPDTETETTKASAFHRGDKSEDILTPVEVAKLFRVDPKTIARWAESGKIRSFKTLGGHRRFRRHWIESMIDQAAAGGHIK